MLLILNVFSQQLNVLGDGRITEWKEYYKLDAINGFLDYLANKYEFVELETLPEKTVEDREMRVVKVCKGGCGSKKAVWIDGGIHAR